MQFDLFFNSERKDASKIIRKISEQDGVTVYEIHLDSEISLTDTPIWLSWKQPMIDGYSVWTPMSGRKKGLLQWNGNESCSKLYCGAPVLSLLSYSGNNNTTVAISDNITPCKITFGVDDFAQKEEFGFNVLFFTEPTQRKEFTAYIRIDQRDIGFIKTLNDVALWWKNTLKLKNDLPKSAEAPLYSTWYNFHQSPKQEKLEQELKIAKEIGFKTVILDDGWQFDGSGVGNYACCGDWEVSKEKFSNFCGFVNTVHALGMKLMVWFPVPFVGVETNDYKKFKDKLLYFDEGSQAGVLDIRYKEVREYIFQIYLHFVQEYGIDGLKLDFIDSFKITKDTPGKNDEMDADTVEEAVGFLLIEIIERMKRINPDFLIEFRQHYTGAEIVKHCNMLRVLDCAYDSITNRIGIIDLRALAPYTAIHSDMLFWAKREEPNLCARQLLNIMFGVPQISVLLTEASKEQLAVIKNHISYWTKNAETLLHGELTVKNPEANYSSISAETKQKKITVLYSENFYNPTQSAEDVFNATGSEFVVLELEQDRNVTVFDVYGNKIFCERIGKGIRKVCVCLSGRIEIR